jgi:hypothetical protein
MKKQRNADLVDYLLRTRPKFSRGEAGRKAPNAWKRTDGVISSAHLLASYWGWDVEYLYCEMLEFALKHHNKVVRNKNQKELLKVISKHISAGSTRIFAELGNAVRAIKEAPYDPLGTSISLALIIIENRKDRNRTTPAQVVAIAEDFFDMKTAKERDSVRASLFRTAKKVLRK